jgi:hypothetical protein
MAKHPRFEIHKDKKGELRFNLTAANGQVVLSSEGYKTKAACKNGIASVQKNCTDDACFERKMARNGKHYFALMARNKQVIGASQMYSAKRSMENGIASVRTNAPKAGLQES